LRAARPALVPPCRPPTDWNGNVQQSTITLRPICTSDTEFLLRLYATTRVDELAQVPWTDQQKAAFIIQQFAAQHEHWQANYTDTSWDIILEDDEPIGRLYVARWPEEIRIVDIALVPDRRNAGIGTRFIRDLFDEGDRTGRRVSIHVEAFNPARRLYERLGFIHTSDRGVYLLMERPAHGSAPLLTDAV
jgi:RimJ/RimL family protein N-acetyltransferase